MLFRQTLSLTDLVSDTFFSAWYLAGSQEVPTEQEKMCNWSFHIHICRISSHLSCPNCRKTISFNIYCFSKSLTKRTSQHILLQGTMDKPQTSTSFFILPLGSCVHKKLCFGNCKDYSLHILEREKVTDHLYLPKEHFPGPEPCHQLKLMTFNSTAHFWLNSPKGHIFPSLSLP